MPFDIAATRALLAAHDPLDALETYHRDNALHLIDTHGIASTSRKHFTPGHLTASAWIVASDTRHVLLVHHAKSGNWFQPGGHIEPEDADLFAATLREVIEECGVLPDFAAPPRLLDIDVHGIVAYKDEPDHLHFDCRLLYMLKQQVALPDVGHQARWVSLAEAATLLRRDTSNSRYYIKTPALFA